MPNPRSGGMWRTDRRRGARCPGIVACVVEGAQRAKHATGEFTPSQYGGENSPGATPPYALYLLPCQKCPDVGRLTRFCGMSCGDIDEKSVKTERKRRKNVGTIGTNGTARALTWRRRWQLGTKVRRSWHQGSKARNAVTTSSACRQKGRRGGGACGCMHAFDTSTETGSEGRR